VTFGAAYLKRLRKLELTISVHSPEFELQSIRLEALVKLDHSDRIIIVHMIRKCANGQQIVETPELNAAVARWSGTIAELRAAREHVPV
jgi:hypothetical protein